MKTPMKNPMKILTTRTIISTSLCAVGLLLGIGSNQLPAHAAPSTGTYTGPLSSALLTGREAPVGYTVSPDVVGSLTGSTTGAVALILSQVQGSTITPQACSDFLKPQFLTYGNTVPQYANEYFSQGSTVDQITNLVVPNNNAVALAVIRKSLPPNFPTLYRSGAQACRNFHAASATVPGLAVDGSVTPAGTTRLSTGETAYATHDVYQQKGVSALMPSLGSQNQYVSLASTRGVTAVGIAPTVGLANQLVALQIAKLHNV